MSKKLGNKPYVYKRAEDLSIPVVDAKAALTVTVTDDDVIRAKKANSKHCALSRAAIRLPGVEAAYFFRSTAFIEYADKMVRFHLPESVTREIVSFDRAHVFASGIYRLIPIKPSQRIGVAHKRGKARKPRNTPQTIGARTRVAGLSEAIAKIAAAEPKNETPEQREFENKIATAMNRAAGDRSVSGMRRPTAPVPLPAGAPTRYVHRTQYVRDLKEPV